MVVRKAGTPFSAKKKTVEEMKKLNERKKIMMQEESDEEEDSEEEDEENSETGDDEVSVAEGSDEDDDIDEEDDDDDDETDEEEDSDAGTPKKQQKPQLHTLAKSAKTPNKQSLSSSQNPSNKKTPNKKNIVIQNESPMIVSPKKLGKLGDDSARTPSPSKQQKDASSNKGTTRKKEADDEVGIQKKLHIESDDDEEDDDEEDDDDDEEDDDESEGDEEEDSDVGTSKKQQRGQIQTPAKSAKTPNKQFLLSSSQKKEALSNTKTPNKKKNLAQHESPLIASPKKLGKSGDDSARIPSLSKQQKEANYNKGITEKRKREGDYEEGLQKKPRPELSVKGTSNQDMRRQRDIRCLFVRQLPPQTTEDDIKAISSDIVSVRIPQRHSKGKPAEFAFVEFESEAKAEENFPVFEKAKIKGKKLYVDYAGEKSSRRSSISQAPIRPENKKKIFITALPHNVTMEDIGKIFPNAISVYMRLIGNSRSAHVEFATESDGEEACRKGSTLKIKGQPVNVVYAFTNKRKATKKKNKPGQQKKALIVNQKKDNKINKSVHDEGEDDDNESDDDDDDDDDDESDDE